jgi:ribonuclease E
MKKRILINASHPEEKRVAIVEGDTLVDFYVEVLTKELLKGNIYKGSIARVEPGLQAAFVDFGPKKHGFLQMREIRSEYFKSGAEGKRPRVQDVLSKGQELIVQVEKDERETKGASLTTYLSIPGRYLVMMPGQERVGISRKIEDREERDRLKEMFGKLKLPKDMGFILRTAGSEKTSEELSHDLKYLTKLWNKIQTESKKVKAPALIYKEQDIAVRTVRDYLTDDVVEVLIDEKEALRNTKEFLRKTLPWRKINVNLYKETKPIFARYAIEEQIAKIYDRYVYLPSKGYLVIDRGEALTAIDVNSGRSRKEENVEATALKTNLEAADEVARQLRLRDIGGLIVIDFIDMTSFKNRREVENRLKSAMSADKAHADISGISRFGLVEMTRERMRSTSFESVFKRCEICGGTGAVKTDEMSALSALRDIQAKASKGGIRSITCSLTVESMNCLVNTKREEISQIEKEFKVSVRLEADTKLLPGQYSVAVEKLEEEKPRGAEKPVEHKAEKPVEHKAEEPVEHKVSHPVEHHAVHGAEHEAGARRHRKRRSRSRGRRRPRHGARPGSAGGAVSETPVGAAQAEPEAAGGETPEE